jgi:excisionase family DNA binding protein
MSETAVKKTFCTTREAATLLGVSVGTVQLWVESGLLQAWKTAGGHRRVMRDSVSNLLHRKTTHPTADMAAAVATPLPPFVKVPVTQPARPRRLRVLVVDDDPLLLHLYKVKIEAWPMAPELTVTESAVSALMMIGRQCPDLLITDLQMPGMDGFHMLRVLYDTSEMADTAIVVVSGLNAQDIAQRGGIPMGIEVLTKPVPFPRLQAIANSIVNRKQLERRAG